MSGIAGTARPFIYFQAKMPTCHPFFNRETLVKSGSKNVKVVVLLLLLLQTLVQSCPNAF